MAEWYRVSNGQKVGPFDTAELKRLAGTGELKPTDMIWRIGLTEWVPASQTQGLFDLPGGASSTTEPQVVSPSPMGGFDPSAHAKVTPMMLDSLLSTRPWVLFLAILGFIGCGFLAIIGLVNSALGGAASPRSFGGATVAPWVSGVVCLLLALLYFFPSLYLLRYGMAIKRFSLSGQGYDLERALDCQKSFWRFVGILTLIILSIELLFMVIAIGLGASHGLHR